MVDLFTDNSSDAKHFRQNICAYNSALAMSSQGAKVDYRPPEEPSNFRINGVISHRMGPAIPDPHDRPAFAQLYIIDSQQALQHRLEIMNGQNRNKSGGDVVISPFMLAPNELDNDPRRLIDAFMALSTTLPTDSIPTLSSAASSLPGTKTWMP